MNMTFTDRMKSELDEVAGAEFERLAESHARERWPIDHRPHKLGEKWRLGFVIGAIWSRGMFRSAAEKAEKERDMMRDGWNYTSNQLAELRATLTPDAITDDMVERARDRLYDTYGADLDPAEVHEVLTAALTEPPARPEGARDIEVLLFDVGVDENRAEVADYLAARLTVSPKEHR